ncbi:MAG: ABC transporter substrate-binding protein [Deltaproteobacteria bacterium]|nr:ABC transporter substrate-binding protein [Deltaproteobacteria bacterium]
MGKQIKKGNFFGLSLIFFSLSLGGIFSSEALAQKPIYGGTLTIALSAEPPGLDPTTSPAATIKRVVHYNMLEGLLKVDRNGKVVPALAKSYNISKDGREYTFNLYQGIKFHDGSPCTAEDVKFSFERLLDPKTAAVNRKYYMGVESIQVINPLTVKFKVKKFDSNFLFNVARGDAVIVSRQAIDRLKSQPVGTGPFRFVEWKRGDSVVMVRNPDYYVKGIPYLEKVVFKFIPDPSAQLAALRAGDVDVLAYDLSPENAPMLEKDPRFKVLKGHTTTDVIMAINNSRKPFNDPRVRQAITLAIDRKAIIEGAVAGYGSPIGSHMDPTNPYYIDLSGLYPYNLEKAKKLLAEAGYPNGFEAVLKLPEPYAYARRSGEIIADQLSKVGIKLTLEVIQWGQWIDRIFKNAEYDLTVIGHAEPFDIEIYGRPNYYFRYHNPNFQELIKKAEEEMSEPARKKIYEEAQRMLADDFVNAYLFVYPALPAMKKEVMNWWKDYPTIAADATEVYLQK